MARGSAGERLDVHVGGERVGELESRGPGRYRFRYTAATADARPPGSLLLSASLPVQSVRVYAVGVAPLLRRTAAGRRDPHDRGAIAWHQRGERLRAPRRARC